MLLHGGHASKAYIYRFFTGIQECSKLIGWSVFARFFNKPISALVSISFQSSGLLKTKLLQETMAGCFESACRSKGQPNVDRMELDYITEFILSSMIGIMCHWFEESKTMPSERLFDLIYRIMEQGVMKQLPSISG
jgi:hypothetical protein